MAAKNTGAFLLALVALAAIIFFFTRKGEAPVGPAPSGLPPGVPMEAGAIPYKSYVIYVWEARDAQQNFLEWRWLVAENGLPVQSGSTNLADLVGAAAAQAAAKAWVDDQAGGGFTPVSAEAERTDYKGHALFVWEMPNLGAPAGSPMGRHWVAQTAAGESVAEGHVGTAGLGGAAEALAAAKAWVDAHGGSGGGGLGTSNGGAGGFGGG